MNSLVHRDYSFLVPAPFVSIYDDRIEFVSVGGSACRNHFDDIMLGLSVCRNPKLAAIFYRLQLIEAYNRYAQNHESIRRHRVEPKIEVTNNAFKITLPNRKCR